MNIDNKSAKLLKEIGSVEAYLVAVDFAEKELGIYGVRRPEYYRDMREFVKIND